MTIWELKRQLEVEIAAALNKFMSDPVARGARVTALHVHDVRTYPDSRNSCDVGCVWSAGTVTASVSLQ